MNLQGIAEAYSQVHEKKDSSYLETDMKKRQANNEKARKEMDKVPGQKNPHFEEAGADEKSMKKFQELQKNVDQKKKNIRGNDSAEQKARLEKKRGMKLDDHPQFKKEEVSGIAAAYQAVYNKVEEEVEDIEEADSLAAMAARREKRLKAQRKKEGTSATGQDFGHDYGMPAAERKKKQKAEFDAFIGRGKKKTNEEVEQVDELFKGKHGQSDKEYADSRSPGGKMVSGDSKMSGAEYTHGRRVKAANPGMQPDVGGKTKPKSQGKMDKGTRADMTFRKAALKKEELEATGKFTAEEIEAILAQDIEEGKGKAAIGGAVGNIAGKIGGAVVGGAVGGGAGAAIGSKVGGAAGAATGASMGAKKGRKGSAAAGGAIGSLAGGTVGAGLGGAIASSHEMEGNPIYEATKEDIQQYALDEIMGALGSLASSGAKAVKSIGAAGGATGSKIAQGVVDTVKSGAKFAKDNPLAATAIGAGTAGAGALAIDKMKKK